MKKIITGALIALTTTSLFANAILNSNSAVVLKKNPLPTEFRSVSNGGTLSDIDAYSDGVGIYVGTVSADKKIDNSAMNKLVYKYGENAKKTGASLKDQILFGEATATEEDKLLAEKLSVEEVIEQPGAQLTAGCGDSFDFIDCFMQNVDTSTWNVKSKYENIVIGNPNLSVFNSLNEVLGTLYFYNSNYPNLSSLSNLKKVYGFQLNGFTELTTLSGLNSLTLVGVAPAIDITNAPKLNDLSALNTLVIENDRVSVSFDNHDFAVKMNSNSSICLKIKAGLVSLPNNTYSQICY